MRLARRSGKYPCTVCQCLAKLEEHHIHGRRIVDAEKDFNLVSLCSNCHSEVHSKDPLLFIDGWCMSSQGRTLLWHCKGECALPGELSLV